MNVVAALERVVVGSPYWFQNPVQFDGLRPLWAVDTIACGNGKPLMLSLAQAS